MTLAGSVGRPVWTNGAFLRLWVAQAITQTAQNAIWYALLVIVEEASHSTTQLGITILSVIVPSVLFGVPAGVYVDRWDKRTVLVVTNFARCAIVLAYIASGSTLALLYLVSFMFSVISQFFAPAETAMIPAIVARSRLMQANSFFHLTFTASQLVGLVFFGPLIVKLAGTTTFFVVMAVLYGLSGLLVWRLPGDEKEEEVKNGRRHPVVELVAQLREALVLLSADREIVWAMGYLTLASTLTLSIAMIAPRFAVDVLGIAPADAVFVMAPAGVGILIAASVLSRATSGLLADRRRIITSGLIVVSVALGFVAGLPAAGRLVGLLRPEGYGIDVLSQWEALLVGGVMVAALFAGIGFAAILVASQTLVQERAPEDARGRVFAVQLTLGNLFSILPLLLIGGMADLIGVSRVLLAMAVGVMAGAFVSYRRARLTT